MSQTLKPSGLPARHFVGSVTCVLRKYSNEGL